MGTWGTGNFEDDTSADFLSEYTYDLIKEIEEIIKQKEEIEPDEYEGIILPCKIEILTMITEKNFVGCSCPTIEKVDFWLTKYLSVYDEYYTLYTDNINFIKQRREVIKNTFSKYKVAIQVYNS